MINEMVNRSISDENRRMVNISLTEKGNDVCDRIHAAHMLNALSSKGSSR